MTVVYRRMSSDENDISREKCRERRHRRIKLRRLGANSGKGPEGTASDNSRKENQTDDSDCEAVAKRMRTDSGTKDSPPTAALVPASSSHSPGGNTGTTVVQTVEPAFGTMSVTGRSRQMEDAICTHASLCSPEINQWLPVHFFAVYDGHGGPHVSSLCKEKMHVIIEDELEHLGDSSGRDTVGGASTSTAPQPDRERENGTEWEDRWRRVITRSFQRMDEVAVSTCACGNAGCNCGGYTVGLSLSGSTAVVAFVTSAHIIVANCGDSRAVLCRAGRAIPLSGDHKPDRPDEHARITAAGGRVIYVNGARVEGILAMSRAIGDSYLKPVVTSEPDITFTKREAEDVCLILASDGMWDVLSNDLACEVATKCLLGENCEAATDEDPSIRRQMEEGEGAGAPHPSKTVLAAALLTRLALGRKSSDNISVIVIDLKKD